MKTVLIMLLIIVSYISTGCSMTGNNYYFEPGDQAHWNLKVYNPTPIYRPPMSEYKCGKTEVLYSSANAGLKVYTIGPMIVPIIPSLGMLDEQLTDQEVKLYIQFNRLTSDPEIDKKSVELFLESSNIAINPERILKSHSYSDVWQYSVDFKVNLASANKFSVVLNNKIGNCSVPSITFTKKDHFFYYPFFWPFPTEMGEHGNGENN